MFLLQHLEDGKDLKFPNKGTETRAPKHYKSLSEYYSDMGVDV